MLRLPACIICHFQQQPVVLVPVMATSTESLETLRSSRSGPGAGTARLHTAQESLHPPNMADRSVHLLPPMPRLFTPPARCFSTAVTVAALLMRSAAASAARSRRATSCVAVAIPRSVGSVCASTARCCRTDSTEPVGAEAAGQQLCAKHHTASQPE